MLAGAEDVGIFINYINKTLYHLILKIGFELGAVPPKRSKIIWRFFFSECGNYFVPKFLNRNTIEETYYTKKQSIGIFF